MRFRPVSYTKEHPVAVVSCVAVGYFLGKYGIGGIPLVGKFGVRGNASVGDGNGD